MKNLKPYDNYKPSGVEWLGDVPEHWEVKRVKFVIDYQKGKNPSDLSLDKTDDIYLSMEYLRGKNDKIFYIKNSTGLIKVENNDILLLWDGSNAGEFIKGKKGILSSTMALISTKAISDFSWYFCKVLERQLKETTIGMGIPHVSSFELKNLLFLLPSKNEQTKIANYLDRKTAQIDEAIAQKEQLIALLKERQQILIHQAVTQGLPADQREKAGLDPNVEMKDSGVEGLGKIPTDWKLMKFKYIIRIKARLGWKGLKASEYVDKSNYGFLSTPNIKRPKIDFSKAYFITERRYFESPEIMLEKDDVLLVKDGSTLGIVNIVKELPFQCTVNSSIAVLRIINKEALNADYLHLFLKSEYMQKVIALKKGGMGVPHLFQSDIKNFILTIPEIKEQEEIVNHTYIQTKKINAAITLKQQEIARLKEYKTVLIDAAVTGKVFIN